ncbi:hypothetical protein DICVIV_08490 [Dictyocaulus viviparus]|uniref:Uncharacterized protein n=1 Tax=Dictyocaulus viviparus TaxID=29172 RepID=A0A0D8XSU5_DICVI|nr:hypothetical protein DICVIV_08490 [Dictyocaulus viviparus]
MFWLLIIVLPVTLGSILCGCPLPALPTLPPICLPQIKLPQLCLPPPPCLCTQPPPCLCTPQISKNQRNATSLIHSEARNKLGGNWVVVFAPQPVTFTAQSKRYCLEGQDDNWYYAFQTD